MGAFSPSFRYGKAKNERRRLEDLPMAKAERTSRIAVTFHVPEGSSPATASHFLQKTSESIFGPSVSHVQLGDHGSGELMFAFQTPLVYSPELYAQFFKDLSRLFKLTRGYRPHFTQLPEFVGSREQG